MPAKIITIAQHKGGVAKTATAMGLASAFARTERKALLVDMDPQAHSTLGLGVDVESGDLTLRDVLENTAVAIDKVIRPTHLPLLDVLPSDIRLERTAHIIYSRPRREEILKRALNPALGFYDYVVIDCPPSLGSLTENAINAADSILIPCLMEARTADALVDLLDLVSIIKGSDFEGWHILRTKYDRRKSVTNNAITQALSRWQARIITTVIPQSEPVNQAQIARTDVHTFDPKSKGALAYQALAQESIFNHG